MSSYKQSITLLRRNKAQQLEALRSAGFNDITDNMRASLFPERIKWAGGLLDICVAAVRKNDAAKLFFTIPEWQSMTEEEHALHVVRGLRIRAFGHSVIIASRDISGASNGLTFGKAGATPGLSNKTGTSLYNDFAGMLNTTAILSDETYAATAEAATAALGYVPFDLENDGVADDGDWHLPAAGTMLNLYRLRPQVNEALRTLWGADNEFAASTYWTSSGATSANAWYVSMAGGDLYHSPKTTRYKVRPVCEEY